MKRLARRVAYKLLSLTVVLITFCHSGTGAPKACHSSPGDSPVRNLLFACAIPAHRVDALELTQDFELASCTREGWIWDRKTLEQGPLPTQYKK